MQRYASIRPGIVSRRELSNINIVDFLSRLNNIYGTQFMGRDARSEASVLAELLAVLHDLINTPIAFNTPSKTKAIRELFKFFFLDKDSKIDSFVNLDEFNPFLSSELTNFRQAIHDKVEGR